MLVKMFLSFLKPKLEEWTANGDYSLTNGELCEIVNDWFKSNNMQYELKAVIQGFKLKRK